MGSLNDKARFHIAYFVMYGMSIPMLLVVESDNLSSNSDDSASWSSTSIPCSLALLMSALPQIISAGVNDDSAAENALLTDKLDLLILYAALRIPLAVSLEVPKVPDVTVFVAGGTMLFAEGIDCRNSESVSPSIDARKPKREIVGHRIQ